MVRPFGGHGGANTEEELADLQRRFHLLEGDRKAFFEASQWTIKQNKETLELVKRENKELREALVSLQRERSRTKADNSGPATVDKLSDEVHLLKKRYNEVKALTSRKSKELESKQDELRDLEKDTAPPKEGEHPAIRKIRGLETKLEKALGKCKEAETFQRTYKHIKKRLKEERRTFDVQLESVQDTLKAKEQDLAELINMSQDAQRARDSAKGELNDLEATVEEERAVRERELAERRRLVQAKIELNQRMEKRERKRRELQMEAAGELNAEGEQTLIKNYVSQGFYSASAEHELQMQKEKVTTYEEAFRRIKEATGIDDVNEVISKFLTQDETASNLAQMTKEAQARIEALNEEKAQAKAKVEELRYSGPGTFGSRRIVDEYDAKLSEAHAKCEKHKKRHDRVSRLLVNGQAGIEHLFERLETIKLDESSLAFKPPVTENNVLEALAVCEQKLARLMEASKEDGLASDDSMDEDYEEGHQDPPGREPRPPVAAATGNAGPRSLIPKLDLDAFEVPAHNVRVQLSDLSSDEEDVETEEDIHDMDGEEGDDMVLDRAALKGSSMAAVERAARKGKARGRRRHAVEDEKPSSGSISHTPRPPKSHKPTGGRRMPKTVR